MSTTIKGVLFDKDGTLFNYGNTWQIWCDRVIPTLAGEDLTLQKALADACGYDIETKTFTPGSLVVNASAHEINLAWAEIHPELDYKQIEAVGVEKLQNLPVIPVCDLVVMIGSLRALGMMVGCATNDFESSAKTQLSEAGVDEQFDFICGFGAKPGPEMLQAFA